MALNSMLRRATKTFLPLAARAVSSSRTYHKTISSVLCVEKQSLINELSLRNFLPASRFTTAAAKNQSADENLIRVIDSEIECAEDPVHVDFIPSGFPFEIQDNDGERTITLTRDYQDEIIKIEVDMPSAEVDKDEDGDEDDKNAEDSNASGIPLVVNVTRGSGQFLEFGVTAFHDEITIDSLSIKNPENSVEQLPYEGPDFQDLDENLQNAFQKYLEIRGIKPSMTNFLFSYMANKDTKEYRLWLTNLKKFAEK